MEELREIKEEYIREIIRYYREKGLNNNSLTTMDTLIHTAKNLCKIIEDCEKEENGYSMMGGYDNRKYSMGMRDYYSEARGRGSNANRDSMGRYSSMGYSGHHDVVNGLYDLMNRTTDEASRRDLQDMINRMEAR